MYIAYIDVNNSLVLCNDKYNIVKKTNDNVKSIYNTDIVTLAPYKSHIIMHMYGNS